MNKAKSANFERVNFEDNTSEAGDFSAHEDMLSAEDVLHNMNSTPIGQLLKKISQMPEIRSQKVLETRKSILDGEYDLDERLDSVLERVLEEL